MTRIDYLAALHRADVRAITMDAWLAGVPMRWLMEA